MSFAIMTAELMMIMFSSLMFQRTSYALMEARTFDHLKYFFIFTFKK